MIKVGGEVDSFCTRCEMTLAHTVIAMVAGRPVKVECNTCHGVHRFRGDAPSSSPGRAGRTAAPRTAREVFSFETTLKTKNLAAAQRYSPQRTYQVNDVVDHPTFGLGWVSAIRDATKVEITFRTDVKVLVQGKG